MMACSGFKTPPDFRSCAERLIELIAKTATKRVRIEKLIVLKGNKIVSAYNGKLKPLNISHEHQS